MAHLTDSNKIAVTDLVLTCFAWFILNCAGWSCAIEYIVFRDLDGAVLFMSISCVFGALFCVDMYFYEKNGPILERNLTELVDYVF